VIGRVLLKLRWDDPLLGLDDALLCSQCRSKRSMGKGRIKAFLAGWMQLRYRTGDLVVGLRNILMVNVIIVRGL
jgi:hypothetical protein